jgi:hypothetical protein
VPKLKFGRLIEYFLQIKKDSRQEKGKLTTTFWNALLSVALFFSAEELIGGRGCDYCSNHPSGDA